MNNGQLMKLVAEVVLNYQHGILSAKEARHQVGECLRVMEKLEEQYGEAEEPAVDEATGFKNRG